MKTKLLLLLFLTSTTIFAKEISSTVAPPIMPSLPNLEQCNNTTFDLTVQNPAIFAAQTLSASNYTINYFFDVNLTQIIPNLVAYQITGFQQTIYVKVQNNSTSEFATGSFDLRNNPLIVPTFNPIAALCENAISPQLPSTSNNGVAGTWNPFTIDTSFAGAQTYTFTPDSGQCGTVTTMNVQVFSLTISTFAPIAPICQYSTAPILPTTSANGITGTWSPNPIDTSIIGNQTVIFTPDASQCGDTATMTVQVNPAPQINNPPDLFSCDDNQNGFTIFNLEIQNAFILGGSSDSVSYYTNQVDAINNVNSIVNSSFYENTGAFSEIIWFRVSNSSGCYNVSYFNIHVNPLPQISTPNDNYNCDIDGNNDGISVFDLDLNSNQIVLGAPSNTVGYYTSQYDAISNINQISNSSNFTNTIPFNQTLYFRVTAPSGCYTIGSFTIHVTLPPLPIGIGYTIVNNAGNQTITAEIQNSSVCQFSLDSGTFQNSPIFENVALGFHTITVVDVVSGCGTLVLNNVEVTAMPVAAPTGNPIQSFVQGATLADIIVSGQNIQWYADSTGNRSINSVNSLPLNTVLVNGTTYYASQKIGGYESVSRLPVTVQTTLNTTNFQNNTFAFSPNPVIDNLQIKSKSQINKISVFNTLGQLVLTKNTVSANEITVDLSELNSGYYLVKIDSETASSNFKILKQ